MATDDQSREVEWQFDALDLAAVERWLDSQPAYASVSLVDRGEKMQHDTYLDTADWRVFHAGYSLRVRAKEDTTEVTLKGLTRRRSGSARHQEFTERRAIEAIADSDGPVGRLAPPGPARDPAEQSPWFRDEDTLHRLTGQLIGGYSWTAKVSIRVVKRPPGVVSIHAIVPGTRKEG